MMVSTQAYMICEPEIYGGMPYVFTAKALAGKCKEEFASEMDKAWPELYAEGYRCRLYFCRPAKTPKKEEK